MTLHEYYAGHVLLLDCEVLTLTEDATDLYKYLNCACVRVRVCVCASRTYVLAGKIKHTWQDSSFHWLVSYLNFSHLVVCVLVQSLVVFPCSLTLVFVCVFPLSSLQSWPLLSPKLPCGLCFISSSLLDLLSTSLLCSQLLSTPTKVWYPRCLSPSATQTHFLFVYQGCCCTSHPQVM